jgi:hypothetical protein
MSSKRLPKRKTLLTRLEPSSHSSYHDESMDSGSCDYKKEIEFEIECARCYDTMALCSDFNGIYYFCENCGLLLHTYRR